MPPVVAFLPQRHAGEEEKDDGGEQGAEDARRIAPREGVGRVEAGGAGEEEAQPEGDLLLDGWLVVMVVLSGNYKCN